MRPLFSVTSLLVAGLITPSLEAETLMDDIVVTATRAPVAADSVTSAVTIITRADLELMQITNVVDYLKGLPGLAIASSGSVGGTVQIRMRGAEANQLLVMIDGVEMNDPAAGDEFQFEHLTTAAIERIEIIRSPMSATWGSDALAGVINIITKANTDGVAGQLYGEYGSMDSRRLGGRLQSGGEDWQSNFGLSYTNQDGSNVSRTGDEKDGYEQLTFTAGGSITLFDGVTLSGSLNHNDAQSEFDTTDFMTGLPADSDHYSKTQKTAASVALKGAFYDSLYQPSLRLTVLDTAIENFAFGTADGATEALKKALYFDHHFRLATGQQVTLAMDIEKTTFGQSGIATPWGDPNQSQDQKTTGFLIDYVGQLSDRFSISGSVRRDKNTEFMDITSWRLGARVNVSDSLYLFSNVAKGYKAPTFIERFGYFSDQFLGNPNLKPEHSRNLEAGIGYSLEQISLSATVFRTQLRDEIDGFVYDPQSFLYTAANKTDKSNRKGAEFSATAQLNDDISVSGHYSYVKSTESDGMGGWVIELRRPKHSANLQVSAALSEGWKVGASLHYTGAARDVFYPPWPMPSERVRLDSYTLLRITTQYQVTQQISLYGRAENALNADYEDVYGFNTPGAALYAGMRVAW